MLPAHLLNKNQNQQNTNNNSTPKNQNVNINNDQLSHHNISSTQRPPITPSPITRKPLPHLQNQSTSQNQSSSTTTQQQNETNIGSNQSVIIRRSGYLYLPHNKLNDTVNALIKLKREILDIYPNVPVFLPHWFQVIKKNQIFTDILMIGDASGIVMIGNDNINDFQTILEAINRINTEINLQRSYTIQFTPLIQLSKSNTYNVQYTDTLTNEQYNLIAVKFRVLTESISILKDILRHYISNTLDNIGFTDGSFLPVPVGRFNANQQRVSNLFKDYHQMLIYRIDNEILITGFPMDMEPVIYPTFQPLVTIPISKLTAQFLLSSIEEIV